MFFYIYNQWIFFFFHFFIDLWKWKLCNSTRTQISKGGNQLMDILQSIKQFCAIFLGGGFLLFFLFIDLSFSFLFVCHCYCINYILGSAPKQTVIKYKDMFYFLFGLMENVWRCDGDLGENFFFFFPCLFHSIFPCNFLLCVCVCFLALLKKCIRVSTKKMKRKKWVRLS